MRRTFWPILAGAALALIIGAVGFVELVGIAQEVAARLVPGSAPRWVFIAATDGLVAVILAGPGIVLTALLVRRRRPRPGRCAECGYDLTGNESGVCPECGRKV